MQTICNIVLFFTISCIISCGPDNKGLSPLGTKNTSPKGMPTEYDKIIDNFDKPVETEKITIKLAPHTSKLVDTFIKKYVDGYELLINQIKTLNNDREYDQKIIQDVLNKDIPPYQYQKSDTKIQINEINKLSGQIENVTQKFSTELDMLSNMGKCPSDDKKKQLTYENLIRKVNDFKIFYRKLVDKLSKRHKQNTEFKIVDIEKKDVGNSNDHDQIELMKTYDSFINSLINK